MAVERRTPVTTVIGVRWLLALIALIIFVLGAFHIDLGGLDMTDLGLAFTVASLVPWP
jgi:hypothetical protein